MLPPLTPRQKEVLEMRARGLMIKEIAGLLSISQSMVKWHVNKLFKKLGVNSSLQAVAIFHSHATRRATGPGKRKA